MLEVPVHYHVEDDYPFGGGLGGIIGIILCFLLGAVVLFIIRLFLIGAADLLFRIFEVVAWPFEWVWKKWKNVSRKGKISIIVTLCVLAGAGTWVLFNPESLLLPAIAVGGIVVINFGIGLVGIIASIPQRVENKLEIRRIKWILYGLLALLAVGGIWLFAPPYVTALLTTVGIVVGILCGIIIGILLLVFGIPMVVDWINGKMGR